ncbi:urease accessory protein UreD [Methylomonas sp. AM2-LC]|uniref:urease accessory protein UreD n=1 Tax=Methylomonas sp. AM2-LC TaxID=3153301 RepID=UPI003266FFB5
MDNNYSLHTDTFCTEWEAELRLGFVYRANKTVMAHCEHRGPLTVQRPFYPEDKLCHVYLLHPPGGVVAGDRLNIAINVDENAQVLITTPAAGKFYRSVGKTATQTVSLTVAEQASLEWLPQETLLFEGAQLDSSCCINLGDNSTFIGWEVLILGRPAADEGFTQGFASLHWQIRRGGRLHYHERINLDAQAFTANWGLQNNASFGTLFACPVNSHQLSLVQDLIAEQPGRGVTLLDDLLICRALDQRADKLRAFFEQVRDVLRTELIGQKSCNPRIWAT